MNQLEDPLLGSYDYRLVALSIFIAISTSYAALDLGGRVTTARGWVRSTWLAGGATAMGIGIWSMHFTGMLAFSLPIPVAYHWPTVLLSLLAAILGAATALWVVSRREKMGLVLALIGSVLMGFAIAGMHYIGMAAMRLPAVCRYNALLVGVSILIAVIASLAAIVFAFDYREDFRGATLAKLLSAGVMGTVIFLMHSTGMMSATFFPSAVLSDVSHVMSISSLGLGVIAAATLLVQGAAVLTSSMDRRFAREAEELQGSERFRQIADNLKEVLALANSDMSKLLYVSRSYEEIWGRTIKSFYANPLSFLEGLHEDDRERVKELVQGLIAGTPIESVECRVIRPDGSIRWVECRGFPVLDSTGKRYRIVGSAQDITKRKQAEEDLDLLSGRILQLQDEERRRIARDLHDSTGQCMVALETNLGLLQNSLPSAAKKERIMLHECQELVSQAIHEMRTLSYLLHPPMLDETGLGDAIRHYVGGFTKRTGIQVELEVDPLFGRLKGDVELALFRVVQESLANIHRHSGSRLVKILLERHSDRVTVEVRDTGRETSKEDPSTSAGMPIEKGVGISSMKERVKLIGGHLLIDFGASGTRVRVTVPTVTEKYNRASNSSS